ncbi:cdc2-related kinase 12 [Trypanosoma brucei equiperdum]|uniref:Cdc2-related kinase 12 n=1 Tax=Trypanosoma brucei equiperdum TaxID=630700 RepID=A0A3L6KTM5_9TRYP|nr:cdc2-related kinase 12 [Trypanosoma brucei equiperdum]
MGMATRSPSPRTVHSGQRQEEGNWVASVPGERTQLGTLDHVKLHPIDHCSPDIPISPPHTSAADVNDVPLAEVVHGGGFGETNIAADIGGCARLVEPATFCVACEDRQSTTLLLAHNQNALDHQKQQQPVDGEGQCPLTAHDGPSRGRLRFGLRSLRVVTEESGTTARRFLRLRRPQVGAEERAEQSIGPGDRHFAPEEGEHPLQEKTNSQFDTQPLPPMHTSVTTDGSSRTNEKVEHPGGTVQHQRTTRMAEAVNASFNGPTPSLSVCKLGKSLGSGVLLSPTPTTPILKRNNGAASRKRHSKVNVFLPHSPVPIDFSSVTTHVESKYEVGKKISEGTYGEVYIGRCRTTGEYVALKRLKVLEGLEGFPITSLREVIALQHINNERQNIAVRNGNASGSNRAKMDAIDEVVRLRDVLLSSTHNDIYLVFPYASCSLAGLMHRRFPFSEQEIAYIFRKVITAVKKLHEMGIIHRDVKADNVLINRDGSVQLGDFGLCAFEGCGTRALTPSLINLNYRPPEMLLGAVAYNAKVDIWSIGCFLSQMFLRVPPFACVRPKAEFDGAGAGDAKVDPHPKEPQQKQKLKQQGYRVRAETELEQLSLITEVLGPLGGDLDEAFPPAQCRNVSLLREVRASLTSCNSQSALRASMASLFEPSHLYSQYRGFRSWFIATAERRRRSPTYPAPSPECLDVLTAIFQLDPRKRPTAAQLLEMPFFDLSRAVSSPARRSYAAYTYAEVEVEKAELLIREEMAEKLQRYEGSHLLPYPSAA